MCIRDSHKASIRNTLFLRAVSNNFFASAALTVSGLKQNSGVEIVSNPKIIVSSGEKATIHVGVRQPNYETLSEAGAGNTVTTTRQLSDTLPFIDTGVILDVEPTVNTESTICSFQWGPYDNAFCPILITCGGPAFEDVYCYVNDDSQSWLYENTGPESLAILFSAGSIESNTWDHLTIYDGSDNNAPVLFDHNTFVTIDLGGLLVISTGRRS